MPPCAYPSWHLPSPSSHQSPDPLFIHPWSHYRPSGFHPVLSTCYTLFEKRKSKPNIGTCFHCQYEPVVPLSSKSLQSNFYWLIYLIHVLQEKVKVKIDIRMLRIWACWSYHVQEFSWYKTWFFCLPCGRWVLFVCSLIMVTNVSVKVMPNPLKKNFKETRRKILLYNQLEGEPIKLLMFKSPLWYMLDIAFTFDYVDYCVI